MADSMITAALDKGLNSVVPPVMAEHGTLLNVLNYEVVPQIGYKKIDGYEITDGFTNGAVDQVYRVGIDSTSFALGDVLYTDQEEVLGVVVGKPTAATLDYVQIGIDADVTTITSLWTAGGEPVSVTIEPVSLHDLRTITPQEQLDLMRQYSEYLRSQVVQADGKVLGLHWFDNKMYAVVEDSLDATKAQLYYAADEIVAAEEGLTRGFHPVDSGMFVEFSKGYSTDDRLVTYSRSFSSVEEETRTSPTPITSLAGSALALRQNISITEDATVQALGWKPSSAPTTYNAKASDVATDDAAYVYADAVYSWATGIPTVQARNGYRSTALTQNDPNYRLGGLTIGGVSASREFGASNAYATLALAGISDLGENLPRTAAIKGIEILVDYSAEVLTHARNVDGETTPTENAAFDALNSMGLKAVLLSGTQSDEYTQMGSPAEAALIADKTDFTLSESGTKDATEEWHVYTSTAKSAVIGGSDSLFGNLVMTYADLVEGFAVGLSLDPAFGDKPDYADKGAAAYRIKIDRVRVRVHFEIRSSYYYIVGGDGAVMKVNVTSTALDYGFFSTGDARGVAHISQIESIAGTRVVPEAGDLVYSNYPIGDLDPVMEVVSSTAASLPGSELLNAQNSLYGFENANFYGDSEWNAMYGVSGASRAFFWDNYTLGFIMTQYDPAKDMPRHIAVHHNHLALGYKTGSLQFSVVGEPSNFAGVDGASELPMGDQITGLLSLNGTTLAVFCRKSIQAVAGSSIQNFSQQTISPKLGAIEYSVVDMGQPVFATVNGISTLEQTAAYGDFLGVRLSDKVATWLPKRLLTTPQGSGSNGVACALPVRTKNQYRLFFKDGLVLSLTLDNKNNPITTSRYTYGNTKLVPLAYASQIDHTGDERLLISGRDVAEGYVMELDQGWGFNGVWFPHYMELTHIFPSNGAMFGTIEQIRMHGQSKGLATLHVKASGIETDYMQEYTERAQDLSMPINMDYIRPDFYPATTIVDHANWGLGIKLLIEGTAPADPSFTEPSHICQVLLLHTDTEGARDS